MSAISQRIVLVDDPEADWSAAVEFRLTYEGPLKGASRKSTRASHKHSIRRQFHRQIKRLWDDHPTLANWMMPRVIDGKNSAVRFDVHLAERFRRGNYNFVPLITEELSLYCSIDILFLRPQNPGLVLESGDIDNRVKTIFDALKMIRHTDELGGCLDPQEGEEPFYCLLEDDKLITRMSVETDLLLQPTSQDAAVDRNDARVVLTVRVSPFRTMMMNLIFV